MIPPQQLPTVRHFLRAGAIFATLLLCQTKALAWVFPEHESIAQAGAANISPQERQILALLWSSIKTSQDHLCSSPDGSGALSRCIKLESLPALAGDHSCSPDELRKVVSTNWVSGILRVADELRHDLQGAETPSERVELRDRSHIKMQSENVDYLGRASGTRAHFPLPRQGDQLNPYLRQVLNPDAEANSLGYYTIFHLAALKFAALSSNETSSPNERKSYRARGLWSEMFALHFLQDAFSAGHIVGNWGGSAWAKGTHDYYSENGLYAINWNHQGHKAYGDAFLRPTDLHQSSDVLNTSLKQFLAAAAGDEQLTQLLLDLPLYQAENYERARACGKEHMPPGKISQSLLELIRPVAAKTPRPTRGPRDVHRPRFRMELGPYIGVNAGVRGGMAFAGYLTPQPSTPRAYGAMSIAVRLGMGVEGVTSRSLDGQIFLQYGLNSEFAQVDGPCLECPDDIRHNPALPRVPSRSGTNFRVRLPFYLIPGDTLLIAPVLLALAPQALSHVGLTAAGGGIIPWQRVLVTGVGDFQAILGREVGLTLFDWPGDPTVFIKAPPSQGQIEVISFRTIQLDLPLLEYRPVRSFQSSLTSSLLFQAGSAIDFSTEGLGQSYLFYLRFLFDARFYLGTSLTHN